MPAILLAASCILPALGAWAYPWLRAMASSLLAASITCAERLFAIPQLRWPFLMLCLWGLGAAARPTLDAIWVHIALAAVVFGLALWCLPTAVGASRRRWRSISTEQRWMMVVLISVLGLISPPSLAIIIMAPLLRQLSELLAGAIRPLIAALLAPLLAAARTLIITARHLVELLAGALLRLTALLAALLSDADALSLGRPADRVQRPQPLLAYPTLAPRAPPACR